MLGPVVAVRRFLAAAAVGMVPNGREVEHVDIQAVVRDQVAEEPGVVRAEELAADGRAEALEAAGGCSRNTDIPSLGHSTEVVAESWRAPPLPPAASRLVVP